MRPAFVAALFAALGLVFACSAHAEPEPGLTAFASAAELNAYLDARAPQDAGPVDECPPDKICPEDGALEEIIVTGSAIATPSITNNQMAGVDEGDIVKARGDTLIILRRGRLFTVSTAGGRLRPVDRIDAYPPGVDASEDWYDEMLVSGDWVVVVGFSYDRGGTEINRFRLDAAGRLTFVDSHRLSSDDYYSERNYASRLVGERLVFYMPVELDGADPLEKMPTLRRWRAEEAESGDDEKAGEIRIVGAGDVYRAPGLDDEGAPRPEAIHVTVGCDLTAPELTCRATAIVGPGSRNFYVTPTAVYVWMSRETWSPQDKLTDSRSWLYRMPLDAGRPQAAAVLGSPVDQYSFREDPEAGRIDVLAFTWGPGDAMFGADYPSGQAALLKLPFARFGDGTADPTLDDYRALPILPKRFRQVRNRFVGDELLYSVVLDNWPLSEQDEVTPQKESLLTVVPLDDRPIRRFVLSGKISRIEQMGLDAVVVASDEDATFTTMALTGPRPVISDQFVLPGSEEAEDRSHAFFYRPDPNSPDGATGLLGLPVITADQNDDDLERARIAYLRRGTGRLRSVGGLDARPGAGRTDDGCVASCHDWYGDARPIFFGDRIFALLGYEVVEGVERGGRIRETRRIDLTPPTPPGPRPYYRY